MSLRDREILDECLEYLRELRGEWQWKANSNLPKNVRAIKELDEMIANIAVPAAPDPSTQPQTPPPGVVDPAKHAGPQSIQMPKPITTKLTSE